jgi:hypothetical protein
VQLRVEAEATMHLLTPDCTRLWATLSDADRAAYRTEEPPGTPRESSGSGQPTDPLPDVGLAHFAMVETVPSRLDCLVLRPSGNRRAIWAADDGEWIGSWVTP